MIKITKKIIAALFCLALVFSSTACGTTEVEKPEQAVSKTFDALKASDMDTVKKYLSYDELMNYDTSSGLPEADEKLLFAKLGYKVISSSTSGDTATVKTEITNIDMKAALSECLNQAIQLAIGSALDPNSEQLSDEEMGKKIEQSFIDQLKKEDSKTATTTVDINLKKNGSSWTMTMDKTLQDAVLGGLISAVNNIDSSLSQ